MVYVFDKPLELNQEQLKFYADNGYLVVPNVLSSEECNKAVDLFEYHAQRSNNTRYQGVMNLDRPEEWTHIYGKHEQWIHTYVSQMLMKHPAMVTVLETIQRVEPGGVVAMQTMFLYKKARTDYTAQSWNPHQDGAYHGAPIGGTLTGNFAFTDQDKENGCMFIYPGSHKEGFLESEKMKSFHEDPGKRPGHDVTKSIPEKYRGQEVNLYLKKGSILILHGAVVHGSYSNISDRDRPMLLIPYKTKGLPFSVGNAGKRKEIPIR